jgi:hypothetical protein
MTTTMNKKERAKIKNKQKEGEKGETILRTRTGPYYAQQSPSLLIQFKLALGVNHRRLGCAVILCPLKGLPRPPRERFSTNEQESIATGNFNAAVQVETRVQAGVDSRARYGGVTKDVQCAKVCLSIFL